MILITKGTANTFRLTLSEKCDILLPNFLFWFRNDLTGQEINIILTDTSLFTERYNKFLFTEPTTAEMTEGYWIYEVYEQASASNTDKTLAAGLVETGKVKVVDTTTPVEPSTYDSQPTQTNVYTA